VSDHSISRRHFSTVALGLISAPLLAASNAEAQAAKTLGTLSLGWVKSTSNLLAPTSLGLGQPNGIEIRSANFNSAQDALTAMISGDLDVGLLTPIHLVRAVDTNLDFVQIAGNSRGGTGIVAAKKLELGENDFDGLKKIIATRKPKVASSRGSINELLAISEFKKAGIDMLRQLDVVNIPNFSQHSQALRSGEFDMIVTLEPFATIAASESTGTLFSHPYNSVAGDLNTCYVVRRDWLQKNSSLAVAFVKTLADAEKALRDKAYEISVAVKVTGIAQPVIEGALKNTRYDLRNALQQTKALAALAAELKYVSRDVSADLDTFIDDRYLREAGIVA
jgi:ABC-type nitrate/sulfonate/bicarbonate transport system substrate-binding protein